MNTVSIHLLLTDEQLKQLIALTTPSTACEAIISSFALPPELYSTMHVAVKDRSGNVVCHNNYAPSKKETS